MSNRKVILDASALVALILREPGHKIVENLVAKSIMSAVNIAEVVKILIEKKYMLEEEIIKAVEGLIGEIVHFSAQDAYMNAALVVKTKSLGLSFGDRACIALGIKIGYPVYTADKSWSQLDCRCEIVQIR